MSSRRDGYPHYGRERSVVFILACLWLSAFYAWRFQMSEFDALVLLGFAPVAMAGMAAYNSFQLESVERNGSRKDVLRVQQRASSWTSGAIISYVLLGFFVLLTLL